MTPSPSSPPAPGAAEQAVRVSVHDGRILVQGPGAADFVLTPDVAVRTAEMLLEAAAEARGGQAEDGARPKPPFPPAELVSPHGAA
jgi:hypothetical protein